MTEHLRISRSTMLTRTEWMDHLVRATKVSNITSFNAYIGMGQEASPRYLVAAVVARLILDDNPLTVRIATSIRTSPAS